VGERRRQATHPATVKPELVADAPNRVWSWDITKLLGQVDLLLPVHDPGQLQS
jgi:putative transposase